MRLLNKSLQSDCIPTESLMRAKMYCNFFVSIIIKKVHVGIEGSKAIF